MKPFFAFLMALGIAVGVHAQAPAASPGPAYSPDQLDQLLAPIALYPDPLIAIILPASTVPSDITLADRYLQANGDPAQIDSQPWDPSVKALAHYPTVVKWMDDNLSWTQSLGAAFGQQPADVMQSIQQLRAQARAAGTLADTPQQQVVMQGDDIRIVPTQADEVYVPEYDPDVVYDVPEGYSGPYFAFGPPYPVGPWLDFECDWDDFGIWVSPWQPGWAYRRDWLGHGGPGVRAWRPDPRRLRELTRNNRSFAGGNFPRPNAMAGAPASPRRASSEIARPNANPGNSQPDFRGREPASGYSGARPGAAPSVGSVYGGYGRGTQVRQYSNRGQESRRAPVRSAAPRTEMRSAPAARSGPSRSR